MTVSVTFRHGTENKMLRRRIDVECQSLARNMPDIIKIRVVFSKESRHSTSTDLIACHISIQAPNKQHINVYQYQHNEYVAFNKALERAISSLSRLNTRKAAYEFDKYMFEQKEIRS